MIDRRKPQPSPIIPLLALLLFAGRRSIGLVSSLDDLTAQVDQQGLTTLPQQRIIALSGLIPDGIPGTLHRYRGTRSPFTSIGISAIRENQSKPDSETVSYYVSRTIKTNATDESLCALRDKIAAVRLKASELIRTRLERAQEASRESPDAAKLLSLEGNVQRLQSSFDDLWKAVIAGVRQPGLLIIRTEMTRSGSLAAKIGSILGLSASEDREEGGFAILAGLRTSFLFIGNDLDKPYWAQPYSVDWNLIGSNFPYIIGNWGYLPIIGQLNYEDVQVVTAKLQAQHVLYVRDQLTESRIQANLEASIEQLKSMKQALQDIDKVAINAVLASVESLGNVGILGEADESISKLSVTRDPAKPATGENWQTVYEVLTDYDDLRTFAEGKIRFHFSNLW